MQQIPMEGTQESYVLDNFKKKLRCQHCLKKKQDNARCYCDGCFKNPKLHNANIWKIKADDCNEIPDQFYNQPQLQLKDTPFVLLNTLEQQ